MKEKHPYLAMIFDFKRTPEYYNSERTVTKKGKTYIEPEKKFRCFSKHYDNKRWALYCPCGHMTEIPLESLKRDNGGELTFDSPKTCINCNTIYKSLLDVRMIYSKNLPSNVTSRRFGIVEKDNFYALYSFATTIFVSATTKKLVFKDLPCKTLYFSKKSDAIRIKDKDKIITVPFRFLVKHCSSVVNSMMDNAQSENIISHGLFERQIVNPLMKFCEAIESKCDSRDVDRINALLEKERDEVYYKTLFKELSIYSGDYSGYLQRNCSYDIVTINNFKGDFSVYRYIWIQYLKRRLCIMLALSVYPPMVTLILSYGPDKFLDLLTRSSLMCSLTSLKKKKPTNPKDILEVMFKSKITNEISKEKKIIKYVRTEERKRKRKLKAHPENENLKNKIAGHPTEWVDSRVPVFKNVKKELKNLTFRKFYVDLFLQDEFDGVAKVFYAFINNNSAFDSIETLDKIILSNNIKEAHNLIVGFQNIYESSRQRLGTFKLTYKYLCHMVKMVHSRENSQYVNLNRQMELYADTIAMMQLMDISFEEIFKAKTLEALEAMHNALSASYSLVRDKKLGEKLQNHIKNYRYTEGIFDNVKFSLLDTPERFYEESSIMNHCVKTYCTHVSDGHYVIYSIEDLETRDRATLSISISAVFSFNQLKAKNNARSTNKIISCVKDFVSKFFNINDFASCSDLNTKDYFTFKDVRPEELILQNNNMQYVIDNVQENIMLDDNLPF
jgi:hypothetical protein